MSVKDLQQTFEHQLKVAQDVMRRDYDLLHQMADKPLEGRPMAAPATIRNFAGTLRDHLKRATDRMEKMASDFGKSVEDLHHKLDDTDALRKDIDAAGREIHEVIGTPNGGPPLEK